jgi:hypothetical protein
MPPIIVKSQISFKTYLNINFHLLLRKRILLIIAILFLFIFLWILFTGDDIRRFEMALELLVFYLFLLPAVVYWSTSRNYKKIKSMSELKTYFFDDEQVRVTSETINFSSNWSPIEKIKERRNDFLMITSNGRAMHYLPKSGFVNEDAIIAFRNLAKAKRIKGIK